MAHWTFVQYMGGLRFATEINVTKVDRHLAETRSVIVVGGR